jgi:O-methyltransferase involved in polyketide biosynthesis
VNKINPSEFLEQNPVFETLFIPLYFRARETQHPNRIIEDQKSLDIISSLAHDFSYLDKEANTQFHIATRTRIFDEQTRHYLQTNPTPIVFNLGAGLDTRSSRLDISRAYWYDIDLPEVIRLRRMFFDETKRVKFIARSILNPSWIDEIDQHIVETPLLIAEGLLMYFDEADLKSFFDKIVSVFPKAILLGEVFHSYLLRADAPGRQATGKAKYLWGVSNTQAIEKLNPHLMVIQEWRIFDYDKKRQSLFVRLSSLFSPFLRDLIKIVEIHFDKKDAV